MFYHNFILAKKGPLARVWLAAHWEKKLSKAHVFETDVKSSVDSIMSPKVKMALRTSGHLLLGVVRIYSRKAKYLLADCTEAFVKIKMAFRPGVVDLPEESRELAFSAVTLPEVFTDLDMMLPEINEVDIQAQLTLNQSRIEEITMKEDIVTVGLIGDDGFGDIPFDDNDKEIWRAGPAADDSLFTTKDQSKLITIDEHNDTKEARDDILDNKLDDGFGGEGVDFLRDGFGEEIIGMDDLQTTLAEDVPLAPLDNIELVDEPEKKSDEVKEKETSQDEEENAAGNEPGNETTLVQNDVEAFVLEPVEVVHKEKRSRRKRKLIVDEDKILATEIIKAQLSDTADILKPATLAPPSRKRMQLQITSAIDKLFSMPAHSFSLAFEAPYSRNLVKPAANKQLPKSPEQDMESDEPELNRKADVSDVFDISKQSRVSFADDKVEETTYLPEPMDHGIEDVIEPLDDQVGVIMCGIEEIFPNGEEINKVQEPELPALQLMTEEKLTNETEEQFETRRWTKRTQQLLHTLKREFKKEKVVSFDSISHRNSRMQAAYKFYGCLLLSKEGSVVVKQKKPFGDIILSKGPNFGSVC